MNSFIGCETCHKTFNPFILSQKRKYTCPSQFFQVRINFKHSRPLNSKFRQQTRNSNQNDSENWSTNQENQEQQIILENLSSLSTSIRNQEITLTPSITANAFNLLGKSKIQKTQEDELYFLSKLSIYSFRDSAYNFTPHELTDVMQGILSLLQQLEIELKKSRALWIRDLLEVIIRLMRQTDFTDIVRECIIDKLTQFNQKDAARAMHGMVGLNIYDAQLSTQIANQYLNSDNGTMDQRSLGVILYALGKVQNYIVSNTDAPFESIYSASSRGSKDEQKPLLFEESHAKKQFCQILDEDQKQQFENLLIKTLPHMNVWSIANVFLGLAYLDRKQPFKILTACSSALRQNGQLIENILTEQQIGNIMWATAKLQFYESDLVEFLLKQFIKIANKKEEKLDKYSQTEGEEQQEEPEQFTIHPQCLCNCLWAISEYLDLGHCSNMEQQKFIQLIKYLILRQMPSLQALDVCTILYSLARMEDFDMEIFYTLFYKASQQLTYMDSHACANALWACSKFHEQHCKHYSFFVCQYVEFGLGWEENLLVRFKGIEESLGAFEGYDYIIFSILKISISLMVQIISGLSQLEFDSAGISMCIWSMAISRIKIDHILELLCKQINISQLWTQQRIQNVIFGMASLGYVHEPTIRFFNQYLSDRDFVTSCSTQRLSNILWSLSALGVFDGNQHGIVLEVLEQKFDILRNEERNQVFSSFLIAETDIRNAWWNCFSDKQMEVLVQHWQNTLNRRVKQSAMVSSSRNYEVMQTLKDMLSQIDYQFIFQDVYVEHMNYVGQIKSRIRGENNYPVQYTNISVVLKHRHENVKVWIAIDLIDFDNLLVYPWAEPNGVYLQRKKVYDNLGWWFIPVLYHEWYQLRQKQQKMAYLAKKLQEIKTSMKSLSSAQVSTQ